MNSVTKHSNRSQSLTGLDHFFRNWPDWNELFHNDWVSHVPAVNVKRNPSGYELDFAAPGLDKKDFKIDIDGEMLTISAEKESENKEEDKQYSKREYNYSSFSRSFTLPDSVDRSKISAKYDNGVLKLSLPKKEGTPKTSPVQIGVQ
ncbi:Hsp20/alpha crystallin family protein [Leptospira sp. 201903071]|uniref:Hsp20/alpha crystallin family protein n=1 Tax=Leptospira ainazelensis TaxID=2810034 RepID=UPI0019650C77|nr:Hsp20/alpha crystallin family protein [Leptospira ainazelensis]MBM9498688.1 Hsp20/alpha crystallin family protein [Leptospira ainazelensis]